MNKEKVESYKTMLKDRYKGILEIQKYLDMETKVYRLSGKLKDEIKRTLTTVKQGYYGGIYVDEETGTFHVDKEHSYLENTEILKQSYPEIYKYSVELKEASKELKENLVNQKAATINALENSGLVLSQQFAKEINVDINEILKKLKNAKLEDFKPTYVDGETIVNREVRSLVLDAVGYLCFDMRDTYNILKKEMGKEELGKFCINMANDLGSTKSALAIKLGLPTGTFNRYSISYDNKDEEQGDIKEKKNEKKRKNHKKIELGKLKHILLVILSIVFFPVTIGYFLVKKFSKLESETKGNIGSSLICLVVSIVVLTGVVLLYKYNIFDNVSDAVFNFGQKCMDNFWWQESWAIAADNFVCKLDNGTFFMFIILILPRLIAMLLGVIARVVCFVFVLLFYILCILAGIILMCFPFVALILLVIWVLVSYFVNSKSIASTLITLLNIVLCVCSVFIMM